MKTILPFWKRQFVSAAKRFFRALGYEVVADSSKQFTMAGGLKRVSDLGITINTVIDIGASNGRWSELCMKNLPEAKYLLIEAQAEYTPYLKALSEKHKNLFYCIGVASDKSGDIYFDDSIVGGGIASEKKENENFKKYHSITIDEEIARCNLKPPFLIKFDTHGYEIPILKGASNTLKTTNLIIMEAYNFKLNDSCLRFHEMISHLEELNFRCIDIVDLGHRKKDNLFWQMDLFLAKSDLKEFSYNSYK